MRYVITGADAPAYIAARRPFRASNLRGTDSAPAYVGAAWFTPTESAAYHRDWPHMDYVVISYATPIAWHTSDGRWHTLERTFSPTTRQHQRAVLSALYGHYEWEGGHYFPGAKLELVGGVTTREETDVVSFTPGDLTRRQREYLAAMQYHARTAPRGEVPAIQRVRGALPVLRRLVAKGYLLEPRPAVFALTDRGERAA